MGQQYSRLRQRRNADRLRDLAPRRTSGREDALPNLDYQTLWNALNNVAAYINRRNGNVTVIAVGGAVNTIHLRSRNATHDVDFFNNQLTVNDYELLINGAKDAVRRDRRLTEEWFNNRTIFFIPQERRDELTEEALLIHEVIFRAAGLTVLAAPWQYSFSCKVDRLSGGGLNSAQSYDLDDAVQYIHRYLLQRGGRQVNKSTVRGWFVHYQLQWTHANETVIARVNAAYRARFHVNYDVIV
ncbi:hypothetical protein QC762_0058740 [Podospora pseudocomata]|uniref:DUF7582 domain-containing protein n=2 Tax=Podospora TaxID=5144 RepID=A0ABR0GKK5_9PEZI|nr:hypothetical protein QC762_0058740 [Podospora pseudocomata]KAK4678687.1 hypothetical protein QC764_0057800 [Podospora pseudoanserina]